ncbi:MAG: hypothetical protein IJT18_00155 [Oscillospiraceae bacterium]|nr:hypothetical protein [Oscillospiraceae bacterium]
MTAFALLSPAVRAMLALWALLLLLADLFCGVLSVARRRLRCAALTLLLFAPTYFLWQVMFDLSLFGDTADAAPISRVLGALDGLCWLAALALLTLGSALLAAYHLRYGRRHITPAAVKLFLDRLPCGICCWRNNGRVLFSNICMNDLCKALTGAPLMSGDVLRAAAPDGVLTANGRVWRICCRTLDFGGERIKELIASDITAEHAKTQTLERDKAELSALNRELLAYYGSIDDAVRREEILRAKVTIHDEMNRLMLTTTAADSADAAELDRIFSLWEQNALLLGKAAEKDREAADMAEQLAAALGIRLIRPGAMPQALNGKQRDLLHSAALEAIANAAKHAEAKTVTVTFSETETALECRFTNDGKRACGEPRFTGGLANLSLLAEKQGAEVFAECGQDFTLVLRFPKTTEDVQPFG